MSAAGRIKMVGDGFDLAAVEARKRGERPWLYEATPERIEEATAERTARLAPIGIPLAVKIGVGIGQARKRQQLTDLSAHADAALAGGFIDRNAYDAIGAALLEKEKGLEWWRGYWQRIAAPQVLRLVTDEERGPRIQHRAQLAAAGPMPPELAKFFSVGELAVLKIIADEVWRRGTCGLSKKEISDRAQASETTVHNATRKAESRGLIEVKRRPMKGRKNLPNLILIKHQDWLMWVIRPKYREAYRDRVIAAEAKAQKPPQTQGANRSTPQSDHIFIYRKNPDGTWGEEDFRGKASANGASNSLWRLGSAASIEADPPSQRRCA